MSYSTLATKIDLSSHYAGGHYGGGSIDRIEYAIEWGFGRSLGSMIAHHLPILAVVAVVIVVLIAAFVLKRRSGASGVSCK